MDGRSNIVNAPSDMLLTSGLQVVWLPFKTDPNQKSATVLDVDLWNLKRAYDVPLEFLDNSRDPGEETGQSEHEEEEDEIYGHHPIEFCESQITEELEEDDEDKICLLQKETDHEYKCCHCCFVGTILQLRDHQKCHHSGCVGKNWCKDCEVQFESETVFRLHHVQEHVFYCPKCFKSFKRQNQLLVHLTIHSKDKCYKCPTCKKVFPARRYFVRHLERHEKNQEVKEKKVERIFKCTECQKAFSKKESLVKHTKIHTRDSLKCSLCEFTCVKKVTLKMHFISHEGNRKYKCDHCDFSFKQIGHLKRHIARFNH